MSPFLAILSGLSGVLVLSGIYQVGLTIRGRKIESLALSISCFALLLYVICNIRLYQVTTVSAYFAIVSVQMFGTAGFGLSLLWSWILLSRASARILLPFAGLAIFFLVARLINPAFLYSGVRDVASYMTPWRERLALLDGSLGFFGYAYVSMYFAILVTGLIVAIRGLSRSPTRIAKLAIFSVGFLFVGVINDFVVLATGLKWIFLTEITFTAFVVMMSVQLSDQAIAGVRLADKLAESEKKLAESQQELSSILLNTPDVIYRLDPLGRITFVTEAVRRYGHDPARMIGTSIFDYVHVEDRGLAEGQLNGRHTDAESTNTAELRLFPGSERVFLVHSRGIYSEDPAQKGTFLGTQGTARDITERRLAEEATRESESRLAQAQKMEAIGTLTSGIAHDFNNILVGIIGSLSLLQQILDAENISQRDSASECLRISIESSSRAAAMIKQLLAIARKQEMNLELIDLTRCIRNVQTLCLSSFPKCITIDLSLPSTRISILADSARVEQMLLNMCVNSMHAMTIMRSPDEHQGGTLRIEALSIPNSSEFRRSHVEAQDAKTYVNVRIIDTGVGMDEGTRQRIFEPFFSTKDAGVGTGLGLSMTYATLRQLGGFVEVDSSPGSGSCFSLYLPQMEIESAGLKADAFRDRVPQGSGKILVIDDESGVRRLAQMILVRCGYKVSTASSAAEGVALFTTQGEHFDAVLLDMSMPGMTGLEVARLLKEHDKNVRILLSSGLLESETIVSSAPDVVRGFLNKPYSSDDLCRKMKEVLE